MEISPVRAGAAADGNNGRTEVKTIRAIIVEDEATIRNGMLRHVMWNELGVDEVETAENAEQAMGMFEMYRPDIILSDIRMPGMYGTELCRAYRQWLPDCQIIFVSGYSDKEYLTSAIRLGAVSYIEKPIDVEELSGAIQTAVSRIQHIYQQKQAILYSMINAEQDGSLSDLAEDGGLRRDSSDLSGRDRTDEGRHGLLVNLFFLGAGHMDESSREDMAGLLNQEIPGEHLTVFSDTIDAGRQALLFLANHRWDPETCEQICRCVLSFFDETSSVFLSYSGDLTTRREVFHAYRQNLNAFQNVGWSGWNSFVSAEMRPSELREATLGEEELASFCQLLRQGKKERLAERIDRESNKLMQEHACVNFAVRHLYYQLDQKVSEFEKDFAGMKKSPDYIGQSTSIAELRDHLIEHVEEALEQTGGEGGSGAIIRTVCEYIESHTNDRELSLNRLAGLVSLTPSYLSALFHKKTGKTVVQYINDTRLQKAAELMKDPVVKLYQVADAAGYDDVKYFARQFRKKYGVSPSQYRDSQ